jgi:RNA polymerase sigma-70 factor, ECF subfamily
MINDKEKKDEDIVKEVINGDKEAFGFLIYRFEKKIFRYINRFIYDDSEAEDLLQGVFIKAYINLNSFNFNFKFSPWIYRIAHNEIVNYIKKQQKNKLIFDIDWDVIVPINVGKSMSEEIDINKLDKWLKDHINKIPDKYKEVLVLYYFEDMSYKEIADIIKIPIATVGVRIRRAKELVRKNYNKYINNKNKNGI